MNTKLLDFRSDTVTQPTEAMRSAMASAIVGDDTMGEDPTVRRLEAMSAELLGKEAALFVISGTMANQVAIMALTQLGDEIIAGENSHLYNFEAGGVAALSGAQIRPMRAEAGMFNPAAVRKSIRPKGIQSAVSRVLCLENTYDLTRGIPVGLEYHQEMAEIAHRHDMVLYLDGARIFNAALSQGLSVKALCAPIDCLQFCLSKGLAAPVGALLVGSKAFIDRARWIRQRIGGGMRQAGHMAAAGIVALEQMTGRLAEDHENATRLANGLAAIDERLIDRVTPRTNIVRIDFGTAGYQPEPIVKALLEQQIKIRQLDQESCRMITHWGIDADDIESVLAVFSSLLKRK
ncbi:MAG: GntG family PLP-dependent aldolase [Betaproteobacteria bacterium]